MGKDHCRMFILVYSGCHNRIPLTWGGGLGGGGWAVAYKQQKFVYHSSRGWEVQGQDPSRFGVWWEPTSWFKKVSPSSPNHHPKSSFPNNITLGIGISRCEFWWETSIQFVKTVFGDNTCEGGSEESRTRFMENLNYDAVARKEGLSPFHSELWSLIGLSELAHIEARGWFFVPHLKSY